MHLLHLRSVKWGPPLSKVGTCSKFSLFRKRGIFRQLARFICQPFNVRRPNLTLIQISHAFRNLPYGIRYLSKRGLLTRYILWVNLPNQIYNVIKYQTCLELFFSEHCTYLRYTASTTEAVSCLILLMPQMCALKSRCARAMFWTQQCRQQGFFRH